MTVLIVLLFSIYFLFVAFILIGLDKLKRGLPLTQMKNTPLVSIVIAARNEESKIRFVINDILKQTYSHYEVIIVDDHSTDNTAEVVSEFTRDTKIKILNNRKHGKKEALTLGIQNARGIIIVTTDADCRLPTTWLQKILVMFDNSETQLVFGGVRITASSFFSSLQAHEFMSLIGTAAASAAFGLPTMCNGANLAFRKTAFDSVEGYSGTLHIPSGDDEFLMQKILKRYPDSVRFVSDQGAVVSTLPVENLLEFVHQRLRWAGKWRYSFSLTTMTVAVFIFSFHIAVLVLPVLTIRGSVPFFVCVFLMLTKFLLEAVFLKKTASFLAVLWRWRDFFILQIVYSFYAVGIGLISTFSTFRWKGRKLKSFTVSAVKK